MRAESSPELDGLHHVSLTVSSVDQSVAWYGEVLGFSVVAARDDGVLDKAMLRDAAGTMILVLVGHHDRFVDGAFDEFRAGMDHLSFAVRDRTVLEEWAGRLDALGIEHSPISRGSTGELIAFRDPDNIALEFYTRA